MNETYAKFCWLGCRVGLGVLKAFAFFFCLEHRHDGWCNGHHFVTMRERSRKSQRYVSWHSWAAEPKPTATYLWSHYIRTINLYWIIAFRVKLSVSCTKHISKWVQRWLKETAPQMTWFYSCLRIKDKFRGQFNQMPGTNRLSSSPGANREELPNLIIEGTEQPSSEASKLIVYLKLIHKQSQGSKMKPVMDAAISAVCLLWF